MNGSGVTDETPDEGVRGTSATSAAGGAALPRMSPITALIDGRDGAGEIRRAAADYAVALLAQNRHAEAHDVLDIALREPGEEPSRAQLMLLRAECDHRLGAPGTAVEDLLDAVESDPDYLQDAVTWLRILLLADDAQSGRLDLLERRAPLLRQRVTGERLALVASLEFVAAVLEHDLLRAQDASDRMGDTELSRQILREIRTRTPDDARVFAALAQLEADLALRHEALQDIERAIELRSSTDQDLREYIDLLELKATLLDPDTEAEAIADIYLSAGERAYHAAEIELADRLLTASLETKPRAYTLWTRADTLRLRSLEILDHAKRLPALQRALSDWEAGAALETPDRNCAWALDTLGYIYRDLSEVEQHLGADHLLSATDAFERRILLDDDSFRTWLFLALSYSGLGLPAAALQAAHNAQLCDDGIDDSSGTIMFATAWAEMQIGSPGATTTLEQIVDQQPPVHRFIRGFALYFLKRYDESRTELELVFDDKENELIARMVIAKGLLQQERPEQAVDEFQEIARLLQAGHPRSQDFGDANAAYVAYSIERFQDAITLLRPILKGFTGTSYTVSDVMGTLMLCHLANGDVPAAADMMNHIRLSMRDAADAVELVFDLRGLAARQLLSQSTEAARTALLFADELDSIVDTIREQGGGPTVAVYQLVDFRRRYADTQVVCRRALDLTMSRLLIEDEHWEQAAHTCRDLLKDHRWSEPERSALVSRLLAAVDKLLHAAQLADAERVLISTLELPGLDDAPDLAPINARRTLAALLRGDRQTAQQAADACRSLPADAFPSMLRATIGDPAELRRLRQAVRAIKAPHFAAAFDAQRDEWFQLNSIFGDWGWPIATPIVLEIASDLVPPDTGPTGPLFGESMPALRNRVLDATGVTLPGIRVRENSELSSGAFRVSLSDGWPVCDSVWPGYVFMACSPGYVISILGEMPGLRPATDPLTGAEACWVPMPGTELGSVADGLQSMTQRAFAWIAIQANRVAGAVKWRRLRAETGASDDPLSYPLRVLEGHVLANVASILFVDDTAALLEKWRDDGLLELGDDAPERVVVRLTTIFRDLLAQGHRLVPMAGSGPTLARIGIAEVAYDDAMRTCRDLFPKTSGSHRRELDPNGA